MNDELLISVIGAGGDRWRSLLARAVAAYLRRSIAAGNESFEDDVGRLEDWLLDVLCSLRSVNASRGGRGDQREACGEAGAAIVRLSVCLAKLRREALATVSKQ